MNEVILENMSVEEGRSIKNFWQKKLNNTLFLSDLFDGHGGEDVPILSEEAMQDVPPRTGKHLALARKVKELINQNNGEDAINQERDVKLEQEKADLYALTKYMIYLNSYYSLPNQSDKVEDEYTFESIPSELIPYLTQLLKERGDAGSKYGVQKAVEREYGRVSKKIKDTNTFNSLKGKLAKLFHERVYPLSSCNSEDLADFAVTIVKDDIKSKNLDSGKNFVKAVDIDNTKYYYYNFIENPVIIKETNRADLLILKKAMKWRGKIPQESGLIEQLGLKSALFNSLIDKTLFSKILNINSLEEGIGAYAEKLKAISWPQLWSICAMQLKENYFDAFSNGDSTTVDRVNPIYKFVATKTQEEQDLNEESFNQLKGLPETREEAGHFALSKYISYMSMSYGLSHNEKGAALKQFNPYSPVLKNYIKEGLEEIEGISIRRVMAAQAYIWGQRLLTDCPKFVEQNALKSWMLKEKK